MLLEQRRQATLQQHLSDRQVFCLLRGAYIRGLRVRRIVDTLRGMFPYNAMYELDIHMLGEPHLDQNIIAIVAWVSPRAPFTNMV